jgi:hypothetical protein
VSGGKPSRAPEVGIIYLVGDKLWVDSTPVARALNLGDYVIHERDHCHYWEQLVKQGAFPNTKYTKFPRGRVSYNRKTGKFTLLADRCILREKKLINAIFSRMRLPVRRTITGTDGAYRCGVCARVAPLSR